MKDIKINTKLMKFRYVISWLGFIGSLMFFWFIALLLYSYGKDTIDNKNKEKDVLNMTYQKFVFVVGSFVAYLYVIGFVISLVFRIL